MFRVDFSANRPDSDAQHLNGVSDPGEGGTGQWRGLAGDMRSRSRKRRRCIHGYNAGKQAL